MIQITVTRASKHDSRPHHFMITPWRKRFLIGAGITLFAAITVPTAFLAFHAGQVVPSANEKTQQIALTDLKERFTQLNGHVDHLSQLRRNENQLMQRHLSDLRDEVHALGFNTDAVLAEQGLDVAPDHWLTDAYDVQQDKNYRADAAGPFQSQWLSQVRVIDSKLEQLEARQNALTSFFEKNETDLSLNYLSQPVREGWLSSTYGYREDPFTGERRWHNGIDYASRTGEPVIALASGIVTFSGNRSGYGNMVTIEHPDGLTTLYSHAKSLKVSTGERVQIGDTIATVGSTGRSTGPHVHLEIHEGDQSKNPRTVISKLTPDDELEKRWLSGEGINIGAGGLPPTRDDQP